MGVQYVEAALGVDSPQMTTILASAREHSIAVSLGFSERSGDSVYISQALIDETGALRVTRRKMKPTHLERTIFGDASGDCLAQVVDLPGVGKVGSLSCWEHVQPLLKFYTFSQGQQIHISAWPPLYPFEEGSPGFYSMTADGMAKAITLVDGGPQLIVAPRLSQSFTSIRNGIAGLCAPLRSRHIVRWSRSNETGWQPCIPRAESGRLMHHRSRRTHP